MLLTAHLTKKIAALIPKGENFAIAFSGGGDSTALVHALKDHSQASHAYIVDHKLRKGSGAEVVAAKQFALDCGYDTKILTWEHSSPTSALQEKARNARYAFIGHQCRKDGINYVLTAHSEDDQAETLLMRYDRKTDWRGAAGIAEMAYGPVWPALAMVTLVRPLLDMTRQELRDYNHKYHLTWSEDPSNENRDYARIRARDYLKSRARVRSHLLETARDMRSCLVDEKYFLRGEFARIGQIDANGIITLSEVPLPEFMFHALRCAGGRGGIVDRARIKHLLFHMRADNFKSATLGGALVVRHEGRFVICRDPVAVKGRQDSHHERRSIRSGLNFRLNNTPRIWDGRFSVTGPKRRSYIGSVHQNMELLLPEQVEILKRIPKVARLTLPVSKKENLVRILGHGNLGSRTVISLVKMRLEAALGGTL